MNVWDFTPLNGREMQEIEQGLGKARFEKDPAELRRLVRMAARLFFFKRDVATVFPFYGAVMGALDRGAWNGKGLRRWVDRRVITWAKTFFGRKLMREYPGRPGWNDFYMVRWCMTGDETFLVELHKRAYQDPGENADDLARATFTTAKWMLDSMRSKYIDLDVDLSLIERHTGHYILHDRRLDQIPILQAAARAGQLRVSPDTLDVPPIAPGARDGVA